MIKRLNYSFQGTFLAGVASLVLAFISRIKQSLSFVTLKVDGRNSCTLKWKLQQPGCRSEKANTRRHWYRRHTLFPQDRDVREKTPCLSSHRTKDAAGSAEAVAWPSYVSCFQLEAEASACCSPCASSCSSQRTPPHSSPPSKPKSCLHYLPSGPQPTDIRHSHFPSSCHAGFPGVTRATSLNLPDNQISLL